MRIVRAYGEGVFIHAHRREMFGDLQLEARLGVRPEDGLAPGQALRARIPLAQFLSTLPPSAKPRMTRISYAREVGQAARAVIDYRMATGGASTLDGWLEQQQFDVAGRDTWSRGTATGKVSLLIIGDELLAYINPP